MSDKQWKTKETIIRENISCSCRDVYKEREMPDPHCFYHEHLYQVEEMMDSWASQRAVAFAEWMMDRYYPMAPGFYGRLPKKYEPVSTGYPIDQIHALFIKDTENKAQS